MDQITDIITRRLLHLKIELREESGYSVKAHQISYAMDVLKELAAEIRALKENEETKSGDRT